ncbi:MAG: hypothetical protein QM736_04880 [Vicinamibacterales bacterium]
MNFLWTTFTRFEPARRHLCRAADAHGRAITSCYQPPIVIDARMKPWYPKEVFVSIRRSRGQSTRRWREYFPNGRRRDGLGARASPE